MPARMITVCLLLSLAPCMAQVTFETEAFTWKLSAEGRTEALVAHATGEDLCKSTLPAFELTAGNTVFPPESIRLEGDMLHVRFGRGAGKCAFRVSRGSGHVLLKLADLQTAAPMNAIVLCRLYVPKEGTVAHTLNALRGERTTIGVIPTSPSVRAGIAADPTMRRGGSASPGASAQSEYVTEAKVGAGAGRFIGRNPTDQIGWTCWYKTFPSPLDISGHAGIGAWIRGDGKGQALKIQLTDGKHWRDYYVPIDFTGWKYVELPRPEGEPIDYTHITQCNIYFNGLPRRSEVECLVDDIRALAELDGQPEPHGDDTVLASMDDPLEQYFSLPATVLSADCVAEYGTEDAGVAVMVCPSDELARGLVEVELAAGLPSPHLGGVWNKESDEINRSYLFITSMGLDDVDMVIDFARKCGFSTILIGQESWSESLGHYPVNRKRFPNGLDDLREAVDRFHAAGFRCGLHFLAAAISNNDPYLTPVPDDRLVMDEFTELGEAVDEKATFIPTSTPPTKFPAIEGGYLGDSAVVRIGDELIFYGSTSLEEPYGFRDCRRGMYGTTAAAHAQGSRISHVMRGYGYFLHDPDKGLTQEVARNLAAVANGCGADMLYFDGSERLKGPHWRYNALLHKAYWDALGRDDMLLQASSVSPWSWHMLARYASADGHGDLKWYLDERLPRFEWYSNNYLPLDLGWYYIYGQQVTPDQIEYVCQKALGFNCSFSIQTNPQTIRDNPRMDEYIRIIRAYEDLRVKGTLHPALREDFKIAGKEYRLTGDATNPTFRRINYGKEVAILPGSPEQSVTVEVDPSLGRPVLGLEVRAGRQVAPGPEYSEENTWMLEDFESITPYVAKGAGDLAQHTVGTNLAGSTSPGVTQQLELVSDGARVGQHCARYTATSTRTDDGGWSAVGKRFDAPLDLREHVALGVWIHGDSSGAKLKIQPRGGTGHWAQDYYIDINFTGWRFVLLERPEVPNPEPIEYDTVSLLTFYFNAIPAGKTCTVLIDGLKALRRITHARTPAPVFRMGEATLRAEASLAEGEWLLLPASGEATLKTSESATPVPVSGALVAPAAGTAEIRVEQPAGAQQTRELGVRAWVEYVKE